MNRLILASGSPRRKELLEIARLSFTVQKSSVHENSEERLPELFVEQIAMRKARDIYINNPTATVLGADTVVIFNQQILEKPKTPQEARKFLSMLSGRTHQVYTGVGIISKNKECVFHEATEVTFWELTSHEIQSYVHSKEGMDKAGGFGIQGFGATLVKHINGDYFNVVGLPLARTVRELQAFGITHDVR